MRLVTISTPDANARINHSSNEIGLLVCDPVDAATENALYQWEDGFKRLESFNGDATAQRRLQRAVREIHAELRRRIGSSFTVAELVAFYREGTDWSLDLVLSLNDPQDVQIDPATATDAAFYLYMRVASDFAGGRILGPDS